MRLIRIQTVLNFLNPLRWLRSIFHFIKALPANLKKLKAALLELASFLILFTVFLVNLPIVGLLKAKVIPNFVRILLLKINRNITLFVMKYDKPDMTRMNRLELFELAFRNMTFKKTRTIITIGGMALGVGAIVFLVSIGYGLQQLVITRVARLDEMRQADVSIQPGSNVKLSDKAVSDFKEIKQVSQVLPLIGVVAKVVYQGSNSDVAVYGVTTNYLKNSAIKTTEGSLFNSDEIGLLPEMKYASKNTKQAYDIAYDAKGDVAGVQAVRKDVKLGQEIQDVDFSIFPGSWLRARSYPSTSAEVVGYIRRTEAKQMGTEYWGSPFDPEETGRVLQDKDGNWLGKWVKTTTYLYEEKSCDREDPDCEEGTHILMRDDKGEKVQKDVYFAELEVVIDSTSYDPSKNNNVLGVTTKAVSEEDVLADEDTANLSGGTNPITGAIITDEDYINSLTETSASAGASDSVKVALPDSALKEAVVNQAFLKVLGLDNGNPIGKEFSTSFVITSNLLQNSAQKVESEPANYKIVGVIPGDNTPFFYVPLSDLKHLGVASYSQIKIVTSNSEDLGVVREKIGAMGYLTSSVVDTVSQINRLFGTVRIILGLIGAVALGVATLGMFNTLTVSLLERTREVGLMKAMGMTSIEVKRLFLTESMLMGFVGGMLGIFFGFLAGKLISLFLSIFGLLKGVGFIDVAYLPSAFVMLVFLLSIFVGLITGLYPSKRATKISALDALRYE